MIHFYDKDRSSPNKPCASYSTNHDKTLLGKFWVSQEIVHVDWVRDFLPTDCDAFECEAVNG